MTEKNKADLLYRVPKESAPYPGPGFINNTLALVFVLGWQGGTVHQVANVLGVPTREIMGATEESMAYLLRLAQKQRAQSIDDLEFQLLSLISSLEGSVMRHEIHADEAIILKTKIETARLVMKKNKGEK